MDWLSLTVGLVLGYVIGVLSAKVGELSRRLEEIRIEDDGDYDDCGGDEEYLSHWMCRSLN